MYESGNASQELRRIVRISEEIKRVVATAFKINLMAMNAIFLAKRAGQSALGFGVLSNELRRFATDLQAQMDLLRTMTYGSTATVTALLKQSKVNRALELTQRASTGQGKLVVEQILRDRHADSLADRQAQMAGVSRRLRQMIETTAQLVELGSVLARSAKIEAAYGGSFSVSLMQVSSDFEKTIGEIQHSLAALTKYQGEQETV